MVIYPNKPILFGVYHDQSSVREVISKFKSAIRGKKALYIEVDAEILSAIPGYKPKVKISGLMAENVFKGMAGSYQLLAREALRAGLKVVPLDDKKVRERLAQDMQEGQLTNTRAAYHNLNLREKRWERLLRDARSDTVVVAVSDHLRALQKRLGIPEQNCFMHQEERASQAWRRQAEIEAKKIEAARTERRLSVK